ncbi:FAD-binding protein [Marinivivus vitaminiproducens]|uniref:FAD-binding protein n=1 Tax=Marinivivus vitaminiproducens TaxID=3035935 RepID=UPI00279F38E5|nr:FAD-binding protein [Geminicoccaceae bacterium SCSIO 64248]
MTEATLNPDSPEAACDLVRSALARDRTLEVVGRGSKRALGRPVDADAVIGLSGMSGITLYEPEELVMSAGPGTPVAEIEETLARNRQRLDFEPADYGRMLGGPADAGTIAGMFASNLAGPRRIKAGAARDHLLGVQAVTGRGDLIRAGGRVVKNVTGYDVCKLMAGSFGTLALMTELTFKVLPAAEDVRTVLLGGTDREAALVALRRAIGSSFDISGVAYLPAAAATRSAVETVRSAGSGLALIRLEGHAPSVRYRSEQVQALLSGAGGDIALIEAEASRALWREVRDVALMPADGLLWRASLPPTGAHAFLEEVQERLGAQALLDWSGGLVWLQVPDGGEDGGGALIRGALGGGGHATLIRAPEDLRRTVDVFQPQPHMLAELAARVKASFDPQGLFNPGRMVRPSPAGAAVSAA